MKAVSSVLYSFSILMICLSIIATGMLLDDAVGRVKALERRVDLLEEKLPQAKPLPSGNTGRIGAIE